MILLYARLRASKLPGILSGRALIMLFETSRYLVTNTITGKRHKYVIIWGVFTKQQQGSLLPYWFNHKAFCIEDHQDGTKVLRKEVLGVQL